MRTVFLLSLSLPIILASSLAHADAYRCRSTNGTVVISSTPCGEAAATTSVVRSSHANPLALERALSDLERLRRFVAQREQERDGQNARYATVTQVKKVSGGADDPDTRNRIHACLMKITATLGLLATEQARRKVNCYQGTVGLQGECEGRITATGGLTTNQEQNFRQQCRNLS